MCRLVYMIKVIRFFRETNYSLIRMIYNYISINIILCRYLECIKKNSKCKAQGEMFKSQDDEWLFVLHGYPHNHLPQEEDKSTNVHTF